MSPIERLRRQTVARSLFEATDLAEGLRRLGFVQADPIRAPARAQDLILRQRVANYRAGDLEAQFEALSVAEDMLHVYGFLPREHLRLLHPRNRNRIWSVETEHPHLRRAILAHLATNGPTHPRSLQQVLGKASVKNGWGGNSAATTRMLEALHYEGRLAVVRREGGIRIYGPSERQKAELNPTERARGLILLLAHLYAPLPLPSLRELLSALGDRAPETVDLRTLLEKLIKRKHLHVQSVDGIPYVWPVFDTVDDEIPDRVALLAPFDPIVWDRRRFEHLWGWRYRFEAYTPAARRQFGYYALPVLWRAAIVGWANLRWDGTSLHAQLSYVGTPPRGRGYQRALDLELARMQEFLQVKDASGSDLEQSGRA
ncbi:MAG: crosslink repair DNA glycosylase YcaQ family protein [Burkholderiaceae bacterium]|jgi:uncharacterized protein YcaQ